MRQDLCAQPDAQDGQAFRSAARVSVSSSISVGTLRPPALPQGPPPSRTSPSGSASGFGTRPPVANGRE